MRRHTPFDTDKSDQVLSNPNIRDVCQQWQQQKSCLVTFAKINVLLNELSLTLVKLETSKFVTTVPALICLSVEVSQTSSPGKSQHITEYVHTE